MNKETIIIDGLTKKFKNILAVKNISFKIGKGKIIGLLGPNGCGKTTTIGMMLGLVKLAQDLLLSMVKTLNITGQDCWKK